MYKDKLKAERQQWDDDQHREFLDSFEKYEEKESLREEIKKNDKVVEVYKIPHRHAIKNVENTFRRGRIRGREVQHTAMRQKKEELPQKEKSRVTVILDKIRNEGSAAEKRSMLRLNSG